MPEGLAHVVHPGEIVGTPPLEQPQQKVRDPPGRRSVFAAARGEGASDHREESAVDERVPVDEIERSGGAGTRRHVPKNNAAGEGNKKPRPNARAGERRMAPGRLTANDVRGVQPFLASLHFELHDLTLGEGLEPVHLDGREVYEHVLAALLFNEAIDLGA